MVTVEGTTTYLSNRTLLDRCRRQRTLCGSLIRIVVPEEDLVRWCASDQVGISAAITLPDSAPLEILIEKDFRCLDPLVPEEQSDTLDNPLIRHAVCE
jgi:hypothetical protein